MKFPIHFNRSASFFFLLTTLLFYLSSAYFGGVYVKMARFWYVLNALDFLYLIINVFTLRYFLDFNSDHISKGDRIKYSIKIQKGTLLPVPWVGVEQTRVHVRQENKTPFLSFSLFSSGVWHYDKEIHAQLRGIYTLGLSRLTLRSFNGMISVDLSIWAKSFYVYPRLIDMSRELVKHRALGGQSRALTGSSGESYMFEGLREYRVGEDLKNICWSGFMQKGFPVMKTFSSRGGTDIHLFMDRRSSGRSPLCDDTVLEAFLCLVNTALHIGQKLVIHGYPGWENRCLFSENEFQRLYQTTLTVEFNAPGLDELNDISSDGALYVLTSLPDLDLLDEYSFLPSIDHLIAVTVDMEDEKLSRIRSLILTLKLNNAMITEIHSAELLEENLSCLFSF